MHLLYNSHVSSVLLPIMLHTRLLSLSNPIKVSVATHVNVKSSPTVALSDDVVSMFLYLNREFKFSKSALQWQDGFD
jgi:hypothetical protein